MLTEVFKSQWRKMEFTDSSPTLDVIKIVFLRRSWVKSPIIFTSFRYIWNIQQFFLNFWTNELLVGRRGWCCCSVIKSCQTLCDSMDYSTLHFPVLHHFLEFCSNSGPSSQWCHPAISSSVVPFSSCLQSFPASGSFPMSQLFTSSG